MVKKKKKKSKSQSQFTGIVIVAAIHYQVDLIGAPVQAFLSCLPDSEWWA